MARWAGCGAYANALSNDRFGWKAAVMTQYGSAAGSDQPDDHRRGLARRLGNALILLGDLGASRFVAVKAPEQAAWHLAVRAPRSIGVGHVEQHELAVGSLAHCWSSLSGWTGGTVSAGSSPSRAARRRATASSRARCFSFCRACLARFTSDRFSP